MSGKKDILFHSKRCEHCSELITLIFKNNARESFLFVCVDDGKYAIPPSVTHVPTIITAGKQMYTDADAIAYVESLKTGSSFDISPFTLNSSYSSSYTWLTDKGYDNGNIMMQNEPLQKDFLSIGGDHRIIVQKEVENSSSKSIKFDDAMYEKYLNSRTMDDEVIKRTMKKSV